jgi:hypothetical protein
MSILRRKLIDISERRATRTTSLLMGWHIANEGAARSRGTL